MAPASDASSTTSTTASPPPSAAAAAAALAPPTAPPRSSPAPASSSPETHTCPYNDCSKSFSKKYNLKAHLRLHTGEQPFECDRPNCKKKFKWRSSLSSHSIWHNRKDKGAAAAAATTDNSNGLPPPPSPASTAPAAVSRPVPPMSAAPRAKIPSSAAAAAADPATRLSKRLPKHPSVARCSISTPPPVKLDASLDLAGGVQFNHKKKRPRTDCSRAAKPASVRVKDEYASAFVPHKPLVTDVCPGAELKEMADKEAEALKASRRKGARQAKRRKTATSSRGKKAMSGGLGVGLGAVGLDATSAVSPAAMGLVGGVTAQSGHDEYSTGSPGSPVTTDSGLSEESLDLDLFSCDVLPPLIGSDSEGLGLGAEDVGAILSGDADVGMFGYASPTCGALNGLDTRFGPFELDNLQSFGLNKVEGL